jgi:hypothetical protein
MCYRKACIFASHFLRAFINILIQVIFPNIITYLDKTFKEEQNEIFLLYLHGGFENKIGDTELK